jgi:tRNA 2-thiouridine synthesizing protein B
MMRLHQINQLTYPEPLESTWQNSLQTDDQILLIESGILRIVQNTDALQKLIDAKNTQLFYLQSDAIAYGLSPSIGIGLSDKEWVNLTFNAEANISW